MKKIYAYPTVIQTSSKITSLIFLRFCLSKKGQELEKFSSISTLEHNIKEQVSEAHIKNSRLEANVKLIKLITILCN